MMHLVGLDHLVMAVRDLDAAAEAWRRLGFTLSPRGTHSPHVGTANHTIMLGPDYIELLGVVAETPQNEPSRAFLASRGEGLERIAFTTTDAGKGVVALRARGIAGVGPIDFGRPVRLPDGGETEARFRAFFWPVDQTPGGVRLFACQHLTRDAVWIPALQDHANTATHIGRVEIIAPDPRRAAEDMARLTESAVAQEEGAWRVPTAAGRADILYLDRETLVARYPGVPLTEIGAEGGASVVLAVRDLPAAARAITAEAVRTQTSVCVPPSGANGLILAFEQA